MANEPIDQVDFQIGGDVGPLKASGTQAKAVFDDIGKSAQASADKTSSAFKKAGDDIAASASRARGSNGYGGIADDLERLQAKYDPVFAKQQKFIQAQGEISRLVGAGVMTEKAGAAALKDFAIGMDHATGGARKMREGLVLVHEFIRGDFKRAVGSAMIELQNFGAMGAIFSPIGLALGSIVVGLGAMTASAIMANEQLAKVRQNVLLIGGASGINADQLAAQGAIVGRQVGISTASGQDALMALNAHGNIPGNLLPSAAIAGEYMVQGEGASGKEATKILDEFEKELADPAKGAKQLNEQFKLLSAGQTREIDDLTESGHVMEAQQIIIQAATDRFKEAADASGDFSKALRGAQADLGNFWARLGNSMKGLGFNLSPQEKVQRDLNNIKYGTGIGVGTGEEIDRTQTDAGRRQQLIIDQKALTAYNQQTDNTKNGARAKEDAILGGVDELAKKWDVEGDKAKARADAIQKATLQVTAAQNELREDAGKSPGLLKADQETLRIAQANLADANNPKYKPGSGVPKAPKGVNTFAVDAQTAEEQLRIAQQIAAAPQGQRAMLKAQLDAELQYQKNLLNPKAAPYAAKIRDTKLAEAGLGEQSKANDELDTINESVTANQALASAYEKGTAAARAQEIQNTALSAKLKNQAVDVDKLTAALTKQAFAEAQVSAARGFASLNTSNTALQGLLSAGGDPAALAAAKRHNEALSANQGLLDAAGNDPARLAQANAAISQYEGGLKTRDQTNAGVANNATNEALRQQIALEQQELALKNTDAEMRAKELADIQAATDLKREGWTVDQQGYAQALAQRKALLEQSAQLNLALQGQTKAMQLTDALKTGLEAVGMAGTKSFKDMKTAAASLLDTLGNLLIKLYVVDPLVNGAMSAMGGLAPSNTGVSGGSRVGQTVATVAASSFIQSAVGSLAFLAGGGPLNPAGYTIVGENGPEILGPGHAGVITPMSAPNMSGIMGAASAPTTLNHNISIVVSGNGDKELMGRMQTAAQATVNQSLQAYSQMTQRNSRQLSIAANNRALR